MSFDFVPPTGLLDTTVYPTTPASEAAARAQIQDPLNQLKDEINSGSSSAIGIANMLRQAIMNGNFDIWQRGTSFTNPASGSFTSDRWAVSNNPDGGVLPVVTLSRQTLTPGDILGSFYFSRLAVDGAGSAFGANANYMKRQKIENGTRFLCGSGKKVTIAFYARSSIAGKRLAISPVQDYGSGGVPSAAEALAGQYVTLSAAWTRYTLTFTTNTLVSKTFGSNNDDSLQLRFFLMWGSGLASALGAPSAETFVGAGNIDIAQVQVCSGDTALLFQPKSYEEEEYASFRFNYRINNSSVNYAIFGTGFAYSATQAYIFIPYKARSRIPNGTLTTGGSIGLIRNGNVIVAVTGIAVNTYTRDGINLQITVTSGLTAGESLILLANNDATAYLNFDFEL